MTLVPVKEPNGLLRNTFHVVTREGVVVSQTAQWFAPLVPEKDPRDMTGFRQMFGISQADETMSSISLRYGNGCSGLMGASYDMMGPSAFAYRL